MANSSSSKSSSLLHCMHFVRRVVERREPFQRFVYGILCRVHSGAEKPCNGDDRGLRPRDGSVGDAPRASSSSGVDARVSKDGSDDEDVSGDSKWKLELAWLTKALEPALQVCRWALPTGSEVENRSPPGTRSVSEIISSIQRSKIGIGIQDWTLSDFTVRLYLHYLRQTSSDISEEPINGVPIHSDSIVRELIYHIELAKGAYKDNVTSLAKYSMLRESNVLKFVKDSSVMRPGYYIGVDPRKKLVIFGIRGTHTVYDLITDIVSTSEGEVTYEGFSTHFGAAEAARWLLKHELETIRSCMRKYEGYRLRLVGHSLGGATASLLAIMLLKKSSKELGFSPDIVSAIGYATPPCVSEELAESCAEHVTTVLMQDDIIPRLSAASLTRLRNEILDTDWTSLIEKEDWKRVTDLVSNAKQVVSSVQDAARKLADYAKFQNTETSTHDLIRKEPLALTSDTLPTRNAATEPPEELFVPGLVYYLKRNNVDSRGDRSKNQVQYFSLFKRNPGEHFRRIVLSSNLISDHRCDSHYYALRDVLKGLPASPDETIFK